MFTTIAKPRIPYRLDRLIFLPVLGALIGIWSVLIAFTETERANTLERAQSQLGFTVATLADSEVMAEKSAGDSAEQKSEIRTAAIWKALLQYPTASIWLEANGQVMAGQAPAGDLDSFIVVAEKRETANEPFIVHAALPIADALSDWHRAARFRYGSLVAVSLAFLVITIFLARALRQRALAEQKTAMAMTGLLLRDRALESISQGVTITDDRAPGSPIIYTNPAFAALTRYGAEEVLGRGPLSFFDTDVAVRVEARLVQARNEKRPWRMECSLKRKDGTYFLDSMTTSMIIDPNGNVSHSVTVHEDVTELRKHEELLLEAQKMESVGQLTGGIAHDFNNLLTAIKSNAEDLRDDLKDDELLLGQADIILQAADRGAGLVAQLMAFARKQELQPKVVDVNALIETFKKLLRSTLPAHIEIEVRKAKGLPAVYVDPGRLETAILNLCINARDAMPEAGTITIETSLRTLDADYVAEHIEVQQGDYVLIAVTDTGSGMPPEIVERAFTPFFTTKEVGKGTGLGLSMVYGFVKQSGGHAMIYSEVGLGTVVKIYLPALDQVAPSDDQPTERDEARPGSGSILLVEDDPIVRQSISNKLTRLGYQVVTASHALEAIETLKGNPHFDLVFSDVIMPGPMNGADLVREVRRRWPNMSVLLTSGYTESTVMGKIQLPTDVYLLSKPYSNKELEKVIGEAIHKIA